MSEQRTIAVSVPRRTGLWVGYTALLRWTMAQTGSMLPFVIVVQAVLAAGIIVGFGLLIPDITTASAQFLSTGAPTVILMIIGLVMVATGVAQARTSGTFTYLRSLPVPRPLVLAADLTVWLTVMLPSVAVAVLVAQLRYGFSYSFDWPVLVTASVLTALTASAIGYAIAVTLPPLLTQLVTQVLVFFVMLFSPVTFPADRLPEWFRVVHDFLPFRPAADLIRSGLLADIYPMNGRDLIVLVIWCALALVVSIRAMIRRG